MKLRIPKAKDSTISCFYMLCSCLFYSLLNCIAKGISDDVHPMTMVFYINFFSLILLVPFVFLEIKNDRSYKSFNRVNLIRGISGFISMVLWFYSISGMPINDVTSISFLTPILSCIFSVLFLNDKLNLNKVVALLLGFSGVCVILEPSINGVNKYVIAVILSCMIWAAMALMVKRLTETQSPTLIVFYMALIVMPISVPWLFFHWYFPGFIDILLLLIIGACSNIAQICLAKAYQKAEISYVMPFDFTGLIFTSIIAYMIFGEVIKGNTVVGSVMIIFSSYIVTTKEIKLFKRKQKLPS